MNAALGAVHLRAGQDCIHTAQLPGVKMIQSGVPTTAQILLIGLRLCRVHACQPELAVVFLVHPTTILGTGMLSQKPSSLSVLQSRAPD